mmetsp:Transcript_8554/g.16167  ORF Transcript_8554/g.16167 Transcript_8554/m.16167 type:complete len:323 (+) Transcript_8554:76-1044(+)
MAAPNAGAWSDMAKAEMLYGTLVDQQIVAERAHAQAIKHRRRINAVSAFTAHLFPWGLFLLIYGMTTSSVHYTFPLITASLAALAFVASLAYAVSSYRDRTKTPEDKFYPVYMGVALTLAVYLGWIMGDLSFWGFMQPAFEADHLAKYSNVNPSIERMWSGEMAPTRGRQFQDAGKIFFSHKTVVDVNRSASFRLKETFCVAPIIDPSCEEDCGHDFWAVGVGCCGDGEFHCGEVGNPLAKSGVRELADGRRQMFRLAVLQAEGMYRLTSTHPLFFYWVQDPIKQVNAWKMAGWRRYIIAMFISFFVSLLILLMALKTARKL